MAAPTPMQIQQMQQQMSQMQQQMSQQQMTQQQMNQQQMNQQMNPHMNPQMNPQMSQQMQQQAHPQSQQQNQQQMQQQQVQAAAGQQQQQQQPQQQQQHSGDLDPIYKFKALLPRLKESLSNLFRAAGDVFKHHASQDSGNRTGDSPQQKFEKSLEEFYALCDQMEINLKFALEMHCQSLDSMKYTPHHVTSSIKDSQQPDTMPYPQYLLTVRTQINWAKEMHDVLSEFSKNLATDQIVAK
ncbi:hypothetical protein LOTGIDRAFT_159839 [Lottia gigantea]|uniref:Mediator of RNA polymerase II transcription subunit 29 n=1 Tax=Lottia gigantea TaxID=225164 RepID=V4C4G4_LOTGI|nr:hypothetical protein LOTGIDRAFT_159839 [Lottia gigantea]ESO96429.1 hypothetical protein LOTGIDRAFT_159839 [Lottia gigantea]